MGIVRNMLIDAHTANITPDSFREWLDESFLTYASMTGVNGFTELGVSAGGLFCVRVNKKQVCHKTTANSIIESYFDILRRKQGFK